MIILFTVILDMIAIILVVMFLLKHIKNKYEEINLRIIGIYKILFDMTHSETNSVKVNSSVMRDIESYYKTLKG